MKADYDAQIKTNCELERRRKGAGLGCDPKDYASFYYSIENQLDDLMDDAEELGWTPERKTEWKRVSRIANAMEREGGAEVFDTTLSHDFKTFTPHEKHWTEDLF